MCIKTAHLVRQMFVISSRFVQLRVSSKITLLRSGTKTGDSCKINGDLANQCHRGAQDVRRQVTFTCERLAHTVCHRTRRNTQGYSDVDRGEDQTDWGNSRHGNPSRSSFHTWSTVHPRPQHFNRNLCTLVSRLTKLLAPFLVLKHEDETGTSGNGQKAFQELINGCLQARRGHGRLLSGGDSHAL